MEQIYKNQELSESLQDTPCVKIIKRLSLYEPNQEVFDAPSNAVTAAKDAKYKDSLENELKDWNLALKRKHADFKKLCKQKNTNLNDVELSNVQKLFMDQAPNFTKFISDTVSFHEDLIYYLELRTEVVNEIDYRTNLIKSNAEKKTSELISKLVYDN